MAAAPSPEDDLSRESIYIQGAARNGSNAQRGRRAVAREPGVPNQSEIMSQRHLREPDDFPVIFGDFR